MNDENFIVILGWFRTKLHLRGNELLTFSVIYGFSQTEGNYFRGGIRYLENWLDVSRATVFNTLKSLMKKGLIAPRTRISNGVRFVDYSVPAEIISSHGESIPEPSPVPAQEMPENGEKEPRAGKLSRSAGKPEKSGKSREETAKEDKDAETFLKFWEAFPRSLRKTQKKECFAYWRNNKLGRIAETVLRILEFWKNSRNWQDPQFIPAPLVWLRKKPWEAEDFAQGEASKIDAHASEQERKANESEARKELFELRKLIKENRETAYLASVYKDAGESAEIAQKTNIVEQGARARIANIIKEFPRLAELAKEF